MTAVTGIIDAVSYLTLGRVFTAHMTGNVVLLVFAFAGAPGLSISRSAVALLAFLSGANLAGRMARNTSGHAWADRAFLLEAVLLGLSAISALGISSKAEIHPLELHAVHRDDGTFHGTEKRSRQKARGPGYDDHSSDFDDHWSGGRFEPGRRRQSALATSRRCHSSILSQIIIYNRRGPLYTWACSCRRPHWW
jgi:hypothetical protein